MSQWSISNFRQVPHFADIIADRGWNAWWRETDTPLADYRANLEPMLAGNDIPQAFVAHRSDTYLGSALLLGSDLDARPWLTPWIAALWVEPHHRRQGVACELLASARSDAMRQGFEKVYLCAAPGITPYYLARGWLQMEADVDGLNILEQGCGTEKA